MLFGLEMYAMNLPMKDDAELKFLIEVLPRFEIEESDRWNKSLKYYLKIVSRMDWIFPFNNFWKPLFTMRKVWAMDRTTKSPLRNWPWYDSFTRFGLGSFDDQGKQYPIQSFMCKQTENHSTHVLCCWNHPARYKQVCFLFEWLWQFEFKMKNFESYADTLKESLVLRKDSVEIFICTCVKYLKTNDWLKKK